MPVLIIDAICWVYMILYTAYSIKDIGTAAGLADSLSAVLFAYVIALRRKK